MSCMDRIGYALSVVLLCCASPAWADTFDQDGTSYKGRADFVFVGASLTDNTGLDNGVNCIKHSASAKVRASALPAGRHLVSATLFAAGSLIDDGEDYPGVSIFDTGGMRYSTPSERAFVIDAAYAAADRTVSFKPPGADAAVSVTTTRVPFVSVTYRLGGSTPGNFAFFVTPFDVTDVIRNQGRGILEGDFTVSGLDADVCYKQEVICSDDPAVPSGSCNNPPTSVLDPNGGASFALLLIVEDPSLPLRSITLFDGLLPLSQSSVEKYLTLSNPISSPASGSFAFYGLEGDLMIPANPTTTGPCGADEYIEVDGDHDPTANGLCLEDDDNPKQNIFNSSINVEPALAPPPVCTKDEQHRYQCCLGDGMCDVVGVDIDRFDISKALVPGATQIRVTAHTGVDVVYLAAMVLGVDVFQPLLKDDSQIRVLSGDGAGDVQVDGPITYSIAISNTGNIDAQNAHVILDAPRSTSGLELLVVPQGSVDHSERSGGANGTGKIDVSGFKVPAGEIAEVRFSVDASCDVGQILHASATVSATDVDQFTVAAPPLTIRGPAPKGSLCKEQDPLGPFAPPRLGERLLRGGGCVAAGAGPLATLAILAFGLLRRRRRGACHHPGPSHTVGLLVLLALLPAGAISCGKRHQDKVVAPESKALRPTDPLPGTPCATEGMVVATRADGTTFCIDRFEATLDDGALGNAHQGDIDGTISTDDDLVVTVDGSTHALALVALGAVPANNITWYQAKAACANAGKHLCTTQEWESACRGPAALIYTYGSQMDEHACNGFFNYPEEKPAATGSLNTCVSTCGAYDLSGNLEEWTDGAVERIPGTGLYYDRSVRGGSFKSNANALACVGPEFHAPPGSADIDRGFRCCAPQ
jgi:hypothetical protein